MRRLLDKYPDGIDSFQGSLEPTDVSKVEDLTASPAKAESVGPIDTTQEEGRFTTANVRAPDTTEDSKVQKTDISTKTPENKLKSTTNSRKRRLSLKLNYFKNMVRELKRGKVR